MTTHQQTWERVWFITGSSSGFGRALTEAVLARGERVVAGARRLESLRDLAQRYSEQILVVPLDVTKREHHRCHTESEGNLWSGRCTGELRGLWSDGSR